MLGYLCVREVVEEEGKVRIERYLGEVVDDVFIESALRQLHLILLYSLKYLDLLGHVLAQGLYLDASLAFRLCIVSSIFSIYSKNSRMLIVFWVIGFVVNLCQFNLSLVLLVNIQRHSKY